MAPAAASEPLLPAFVPARSIACSMFSVVMMPNITGTPVVRPLGNAFCRFVAYIVIMCRAAADDTTETDDRIILSRFCKCFCSERNFKRSRYIYKIYIVRFYIVADESSFRPLHKPGCD